MNTSFTEHLASSKNNPEFAGSISMGRNGTSIVGTNSIAAGYATEATETYSVALGFKAKATAGCANAEGANTLAAGYSSHAEGRGDTTTTHLGNNQTYVGTGAHGPYSHSEGSYTWSIGENSHAEGVSTLATGDHAHAEGSGSQASGYSSHAEGNDTIASGSYSHSEGSKTVANHKAQHVFGEYNISDAFGSEPEFRGTYVEIVGNGTASNARSNARTLDWAGNEVLAGKLTVGTGPTDNMDVATKQYVDNFVKSGSMIFKGTIGSSGATVDSLPQIHEAGWMYLVSTAGTYLNKTCEVGDMIVCVRTSNGNLSTDWTIIQNNINPELYATKEYADAIKTNPSFTGNMTVSGKITIGSGPFDSTDAATKQYVDNTFINNRAVLYKGTISSSSDLPSTHYRGWLYLVSTAGVYAGKTCEVGDMILCTQQGINLQSDSHWTVIQNNIDTTNMVTHSSNDLVANEQLAVFDGTSGKIIKGGLLGNNVADKSYVDTKFSSIVVPTLVAGDNVSFRTGDNSITISSSVPSTYATKNYVDTGIQSVDLSAYAPKANPEFSGSISLSRQSDSTVGANSLAVGTGTEATELCSQAVGFYTKATGQFQHVSGKYNAVDSIITQHDETATYYSGKYVYVRGRYRDDNTWYYVLNIYKCTAYHTGDTPTSEGSLPSSHWAYVYGIDSTSQPQLPFNTINAEIVGIGSDNGHRKNGRTLDWNGNEWLAGRLTVGAGPVSNMDVTTKQYVDSAIQTAGSTYATKASPVFTGSITIGGTTVTEAQLQALLAIVSVEGVQF